MIISQTPFRISFAGGGSDLPSYYRKHGGAVVSSAIDKFVYVTVSRKFDHALRISYSRTEEVEKTSDVQHPIVREGLTMLGISGGLEITSVADIPSRGTGLGSSSSFAVGLMQALHAMQGRHVSAAQLADEACEIEIGRCKEPIGKQDQYAAAYGGLNYIRFLPDDTVQVEPIALSREARSTIDSCFLMFYTGITRSASEILAVQSNMMASENEKAQAMHRMVACAGELRDEIWKGNFDAIGQILHENWLLKKSLAPGISNSKINGWYERAMGAGALGGKLLGAGGGGFLLFYANPETHEAICSELQELRPIPFAMEARGTRIIFVHQTSKS